MVRSNGYKPNLGAENELLMVFVKNPIVGRVKTRLAGTLGAPRALSIYKQLLAHTRLVTANTNVYLDVWYDAFLPDQDEWDSDAIEHTKKQQIDGDLGERLQNAFEDAFSRNFDKVVVIGSDNAEITGDIINQAFRELDQNKAVIGPSEDGGYYLLGLRSMQEQLFQNKEWGTSNVYQQTVEDLDRLGWSVATLPVLQDIDTPEDWYNLLGGKPSFQQR